MLLVGQDGIAGLQIDAGVEATRRFHIAQGLNESADFRCLGSRCFGSGQNGIGNLVEHGDIAAGEQILTYGACRIEMHAAIGREDETDEDEQEQLEESWTPTLR